MLLLCAACCAASPPPSAQPASPSLPASHHVACPSCLRLADIPLAGSVKQTVPSLPSYLPARSSTSRWRGLSRTWTPPSRPTTWRRWRPRWIRRAVAGDGPAAGAVLQRVGCEKMCFVAGARWQEHAGYSSNLKQVAFTLDQASGCVLCTHSVGVLLCRGCPAAGAHFLGRRALWRRRAWCPQTLDNVASTVGACSLNVAPRRSRTRQPANPISLPSLPSLTSCLPACLPACPQFERQFENLDVQSEFVEQVRQPISRTFT